MILCNPLLDQSFLRATCHSVAALWAIALMASNGVAQAIPAPPTSTEPVARVGDIPLYQLDIDAALHESLDSSAGESDASQTLKIATLTALVRRELALHRLLELGGEPLAARIQRKQSQLLDSLRISNPDALLTESQLRSIAWQFAWNEYLEQHLNETNLKRFFESHRWQYAGDRAEIAHIFLPHNRATADGDPATADGADTSEGAELLVELQSKIQSGKLSFSAAAKEFSKAPSAASGGEIGWIQARGDVPPPVADAAFTGDLQTPLGPIRSSLGWHLIQVHKREAGTKTYEQIEDMADLRKAASEFLFNRLVTTAAKTTNIQWLDSSLQPPDSWRPHTP